MDANAVVGILIASIIVLTVLNRTVVRRKLLERDARRTLKERIEFEQAHKKAAEKILRERGL